MIERTERHTVAAKHGLAGESHERTERHTAAWARARRTGEGLARHE